MSIGSLVREKGYTVWACAVLKNHVYLCMRRHRHDATTLWHAFADTTRTRLRLFANTPDDVRRVVKYIEDNPVKEGLPRQL